MANQQYTLWRRVVALFNPWADNQAGNPFLASLETGFEDADVRDGDPGDCGRVLSKVVLLGLEPRAVTHFADVIAEIQPRSAIVVRSLDEAEEALSELDNALLIVAESIDGLAGVEVVRRFRASGVESPAFVLNVDGVESWSEGNPVAVSAVTAMADLDSFRNALDEQGFRVPRVVETSTDVEGDVVEEVVEVEEFVDSVESAALEELGGTEAEPNGSIAMALEGESEMLKNEATGADAAGDGAEAVAPQDESDQGAGLAPIPPIDEGAIAAARSAGVEAHASNGQHAPAIVDTASHAFAEELMRELQDADLVVTGERKLPPMELAEEAGDIEFAMEDEPESAVTAPEASPKTSDAGETHDSTEKAYSSVGVESSETMAAEIPATAAGSPTTAVRASIRQNPEDRQGEPAVVSEPSPQSRLLEEVLLAQQAQREALEQCVDVLRAGEGRLAETRLDLEDAERSAVDALNARIQSAEEQIAVLIGASKEERSRADQWRHEVKLLNQKIEEQELRLSKERTAFTSFEGQATRSAAAQEKASQALMAELVSIREERQELSEELSKLRLGVQAAALAAETAVAGAALAQNAASEALAASQKDLAVEGSAARGDSEEHHSVPHSGAEGSAQASSVVAAGPWKSAAASGAPALPEPEVGGTEDSQSGPGAGESSGPGTNVLEGDRALLKLRNELADLG